MAAVLPRPVSSLAWTLIDVGSPSVAVAKRDALGTTAHVAIWPPDRLRPALGAVDGELARLDRAASRFRADSEISRIQAHAGVGGVRVSDDLAEVVGVALAAAAWTDGLVDPTVGAALTALGYDRDFVLVDAQQPDLPPMSAAVPGWRSISLDGRMLRVPPGVRLDFGATAKGLGADWAARAATAAAGRGGVLVSLGGDIATGGEAPYGGWPVLIADGPGRTYPAQLVRLTGGAIATSSTTCRRWRRAGRLMHHIVDPRTGQPAAGSWQTVSVAAATCAEANAATTAAVVNGDESVGWLAARELPARLVRHDGTVTRLSGWPGAEGGVLPRRAAQMPCHRPTGG